MKPNLLVLNASARVTRSVTRHLTERFAEAWSQRHPEGHIVRRDLGLAPPPAVTESWIAAAYTPPEVRTPEMHAALDLSETFIREIEVASTIVIGVPLYNFGMPAALKAWVDQIVRINRTFAMDDNPEAPYRALLHPKPVIVLTSSGSSAFQPGGGAAHLNFLEPHLTTLLGFLGFTDVTFVRIGDAESKNDAQLQAIAAAEAQVDRLVA